MRIPRGMLGAFGFLLPGPTTRIVQVAALRKLPLQLLALPSRSSTGPSRGRRLDSSSSSSSEFQSLSPEEQSKWDQLYQQGEARRNSLGATMESTAVTVPSVRVVTFDLDNTIWNTGATIAAANDALAQFLNQHNVVQSKRTEQIMGELFLANKAKYCPLALPEQLEDIQAPVLLTQLRKDSLQFLLMQDNGYTEGDAQKFASTAFDRWMEARYGAIPSHFASGVPSVLQHISDLKRGSSLLVGAITDGNSDPRNIPELEPHFDFCINAERVGVSKPDPRVYAKAMECVWERSSSNGGMDPDTWMEEGVAGPWWIHIGDDFTKDIVAAKNLNMRTVWVRELLDNHQKGPPPVAADDQSQALAEEQRLVQFQKKIDGQAVVQMAVGAEDYLAASIQREFADAVIDRFSDLSELLQRWHLDGLPPAQPQSQSAQPVERKEPVYVPDEADLVRDLLRDRKATSITDPPFPPKVSPESPSRGMGGAAYVYVPDEADLVRDLLSGRKATSTTDAPMKSGVIMDVPPKASSEAPSRRMGGAEYVYVPDEADLVRDLLRDRKATSTTDAPMKSGVIMDAPPKTSAEEPSRGMRGAEYVYVPDEADLVQDWVRRNATQPNKFCVLCGVKIPMEAAFCSTCGGKQP